MLQKSTRNLIYQVSFDSLNKALTKREGHSFKPVRMLIHDVRVECGRDVENGVDRDVLKRRASQSANSKIGVHRDQAV